MAGSNQFVDPDGLVNLRLDEEVEVEWIRPDAFFQLDPESDVKITVVQDKTRQFDLVKKNDHLRQKLGP